MSCCWVDILWHLQIKKHLKLCIYIDKYEDKSKVSILLLNN